MRTLIEVLAVLAIAANGVVHGTDVFGAIVLRPAIAAVDDRTFTQLLGHVHRIADRRFAVIGVGGLVAVVAMTAIATASGHWVSGRRDGHRRSGSLLVIYARISKSVNRILTAAAIADRVGDLRPDQQVGEHDPDGSSDC